MGGAGEVGQQAAIHGMGNFPLEGEVGVGLDYLRERASALGHQVMDGLRGYTPRIPSVLSRATGLAVAASAAAAIVLPGGNRGEEEAPVDPDGSDAGLNVLAPEPANAQVKLPLPEMTFKQLLEGTKKGAVEDCHAKKKIFLKAGGGHLDAPGSCIGYSPRDCHTAGPRGDAARKLTRSQGECDFYGYNVVFKSGEPTERPVPIMYHCNTRKIVARLINRLVRDQDGFWHSEISSETWWERTNPFRCVKIKLDR